MTETLYKIDIPQQVDYKKYLKMLTDKDHPLYFETLSLRSLESWVNSNIKEESSEKKLSQREDIRSAIFDKEEQKNIEDLMAKLGL